ncbi:hypothetical protein [Rufibacter ruber]|uniref:hypothetical protein n=1 Tax=Rufibacter ruber TaxID=1783499 RepID=UPI000B0011A0|nr:hypothetical protein [Rufibacter ruber]
MKRFNCLFVVLGISISCCFSCKKEADDVTKTDSDSGYAEADYKPGAVLSGYKNYTKIYVGDLNCPIILSSPHDGTVAPANIPDRQDGVVVRDIYATDLTLRMADSIKALTGLRPHVVINELSRKKLDPNRSLAEAYLTHEDAKTAWNDYHNFIIMARTLVTKHVGKGLYLDMHGHGHDIARIEVGYLLTSAELNSTDTQINQLANKSSIYSISKESAYSFSQLINGDNSFGALLQNRGLRAIPSNRAGDRSPNSDPYFNGGYCTSAYGSSKLGGPVSAIQLETPGPNVRNTATLRQSSGGKIARAILEYMKLHYAMDLAK